MSVESSNGDRLPTNSANNNEGRSRRGLIVHGAILTTCIAGVETLFVKAGGAKAAAEITATSVTLVAAITAAGVLIEHRQARRRRANNA